VRFGGEKGGLLERGKKALDHLYEQGRTVAHRRDGRAVADRLRRDDSELSEILPARGRIFKKPSGREKKEPRPVLVGRRAMIFSEEV